MFEFLKNISPTELIILAAILLVLFGAKVFTSIGKTGGATLREIKKIKKNFNEAIEDDEPNQNLKEVTK